MDHSALTLLRLGLRRGQHAKLYDVIPAGVLDESIKAIWDAQAKYYRAFPQLEQIDDLASFKTWVASTLLATKDKDTSALLLAVTDQLGGPIDELLAPTLANNYLQQALSLDAIRAIEAWQSPDNEEDLDDLLAAATEKYKDHLSKATTSPVEETSIDDLYAAEEANYGFRWRLKELQDHMRPLRPGDSIIWAARPDRGKTSTIASEITYMATQLDQVYPGEERTMLWLNNEGDSKAVRKRLYQAALGVTGSQMIELYQQGILQQQLHEAFGGEDLFRRVMVLSIHGYSSAQVLKLIRQHKAGLIVFDMVDNIRFNGLTTNGATRTDQMLEEMYRFVRDHASIDQYAAICTSQVSADGEGVAYPDMSMLKDSKTGKQGACEAIVIFGAKPDQENSRYLGIPKNKLRIEGRPSNPKKEVWFKPEIARVMSLTEADT